MKDDGVKKWLSKKELKKDYALFKALDETRKNSYQGQFARKIGTRIVELIKRDPLSKKLTKAVESNLASLKKLMEWKLPELPGISPSRSITMELALGLFGISWGNNPEREWIKVIQSTAKEIEKKWYCEISTTIHTPVDKEKSLTFGMFPVDALWAPRFNILSPVEVPVMAINNTWPLDEYCPIDKLPIFINLSVIDNSDLTLIRTIVGKTVKERLKEYRISQPKEPLSAVYPPVFRDKDLMFLVYHTKDETFQQNLQWYDWHIKERLPFRHIALIDEIQKKNSEKGSALLDRFIHERMKLGKPVKGEDKIEKGVKLIYKAIYRKPYDRRSIEQFIENYNCPDHNNPDECPRALPSCEYYKKWLGRFNRLNPTE